MDKKVIDKSYMRPNNYFTETTHNKLRLHKNTSEYQYHRSPYSEKDGEPDII